MHGTERQSGNDVVGTGSDRSGVELGHSSRELEPCQAGSDLEMLVSL